MSSPIEQARPAQTSDDAYSSAPLTSPRRFRPGKENVALSPACTGMLRRKPDLSPSRGALARLSGGGGGGSCGGGAIAQLSPQKRSPSAACLGDRASRFSPLLDAAADFATTTATSPSKRARHRSPLRAVLGTASERERCALDACARLSPPSHAPSSSPISFSLSSAAADGRQVVPRMPLGDSPLPAPRALRSRDSCRAGGGGAFPIFNDAPRTSPRRQRVLPAPDIATAPAAALSSGLFTDDLRKSPTESPYVHSYSYSYSHSHSHGLAGASDGSPLVLAELSLGAEYGSGSGSGVRSCRLIASPPPPLLPTSLARQRSTAGSDPAAFVYPHSLPPSSPPCNPPSSPIPAQFAIGEAQRGVSERQIEIAGEDGLYESASASAFDTVDRVGRFIGGHGIGGISGAGVGAGAGAGSGARETFGARGDAIVIYKDGNHYLPTLYDARFADAVFAGLGVDKENAHRHRHRHRHLAHLGHDSSRSPRQAQLEMRDGAGRYADGRADCL